MFYHIHISNKIRYLKYSNLSLKCRLCFDSHVFDADALLQNLAAMPSHCRLITAVEGGAGGGCKVYLLDGNYPYDTNY